MSRQAPADELADTLAELARLRLRAAQLRARIVDNPDLGATGRFARAEVALRQERVFDPSLLPPEIREDPRFQRDRQHWTVRCHPAAPAAHGPRPGWPIRRDAGRSLH